MAVHSDNYWLSQIHSLTEASANRETKVTKTVAFSGAAGNGAIGTVNLFTVTGFVRYMMIARCTENLAGALATLSLGVTGVVEHFLPATLATDIDATDLIVAGGLTAQPISNDGDYNISDGADIIATVGTANITDGTIELVVLWKPLSADGNIVAV